MVGMPERKYINPLTDKDKIITRIETDGHRVVSFSVQYEALIYSRWRKIVRYDSAHGHPHRHVFNPDSTEYYHLLMTEDNNDALTEAQIVIKKSFITMRERYIIAIDRKRGN